MFRIPWDDINKTIEDATSRTFESIFNSLEGLEGEVQGMMDKDIDLYRDKIAEQIVEQTCRRTAFIGGGAALPDLLPVAGWSTFVAAVGADFTLTLREDLSMLLRMAYLYGQDVTREDRKKEAVSLLAVVGAGEGGAGSPAREVSKLMGMIGTKHLSRKALIAIGKKLGERFFKRKLVKLIPGLGILLSGGVNYYSTKQLGDYAKRYFTEKTSKGDRAAGISDEMKLFQDVYVKVLATMAKKDGDICPEELEFLKDSMLMFGFSGAEQETCLKELQDVQTLRDADQASCRKLSEQDRTFVLKQALSMMLCKRRETPAQRSYLEELRVRLDLGAAVLRELEQEVREDLRL